MGRRQRSSGALCRGLKWGSLVVFLSNSQASEAQYLDESSVIKRHRRTGERRQREPFVQRYLDNAGTTIWEGVDDGGLLPGAVVATEQEERQRRMKSSKRSYLSSYHGIGRRSKSSSSSTSSSGKGKGGGKGIGLRPTPPPPRPTPRPVIPPTQAPINPPAGDSCTVRMNLRFLQFSAVPPAIFVFPSDPDPQDLGTRYIYSDGLRDAESLDELQGSRASGQCTRTLPRVGNNEIGLQLGRGHCQFTYTLSDGNRQMTFSASGEVSDSLGGLLPITGGSQAAIGAYGEIELLPVNLLPDGSLSPENGDFFLDPVFYDTRATVIVPCAEP